MLIIFTILLFWLVFRITSCHNTWVVRGNPKPDRRNWTDQRHIIRNTMNTKVHTPSYRNYGEDRKEYLNPRLELRPFLDQRRLFVANFQKWRMIYDQHTGAYHRNGRFVNVYDLVTGTPICLPKGTNTTHMWIEGRHWANHQWDITDIPKMQKVSFTAKVGDYTTEEKKRQFGRDYVTYGVRHVSDVLDWQRYDEDQEILADYAAGCPDVPHWSPEYSTFVPSFGTDQNPNRDDSEIPLD